MHQDITPGDVLRVITGRPKITDFGVATERSDCGSKQSDTRATGVSRFTASYGHLRCEAAT